MQALGHDGPPTNYWDKNLITDVPLDRCPVRSLQLARESGTLAREVDRYTDVLYPAYKAGHLLVAGGVADQPARYLALINLVESIRQQVEEKASALARPEPEA